MKKLSKLVYLFVAFAVMSSCEQDTIESEALNKSNEIEALIQEYEFLSDAIESGIDVRTYIASIMDEAPQVNVIAESDNEAMLRPPGRRNTLYVGDCGTKIENRRSVYSMSRDVRDLKSETCYNMYMPRRPWERSYDGEREFARGMYYLTMRWAATGQCSWSEAADIMACVGEFDIEYYCDEDHIPV